MLRNNGILLLQWSLTYTRPLLYANFTYARFSRGPGQRHRETMVNLIHLCAKSKMPFSVIREKTELENALSNFALQECNSFCGIPGMQKHPFFYCLDSKNPGPHFTPFVKGTRDWGEGGKGSFLLVLGLTMKSQKKPPHPTQQCLKRWKFCGIISRSIRRMIELLPTLMK